MFCFFWPNLLVLAWMGDEIMCKQALGQHSHMDTHRHSQWQYPKAKAGLGWKGPVHLIVLNYRPVSVTCTYSKLMEHIMVSHGSIPLMLVLWDTTTWVCPRTTWQPKPWPTGWSDHHGLLHKLNHYGISGNYNRWRDCRLPQRLISTGGHWGLYIKNSTRKILVCSTSLMASFIRSVGGLSKCFHQVLWLVNLKAEVIGQSINRRGVA